MAIRMIESFSWTNVNNDLSGRYGSTNFGGIIQGNGRFAGNNIHFQGQNDWNYNLLGGPFGPNFTFGAAFRTTDITGGAGGLVEFFEGALTSFAGIQFTLSVDAVGHLVATRGASTVLGTSSALLVNNQYFYVEIEVFVDPVAGTFRAWLDGVLVLNLAGVNTQNGVTATCGSGRIRGISGAGSGVDYCDLYFKDSLVPLGPRHVSLIVPTSDGAASDWTPSTGTTHFDLVDEIPPNGDTDYVETSNPGDDDLYGFSALPFNPAAIDAIQGSIFAKKTDVAVRVVSQLIRSGGTDFAGALQPLTSSYVDYVEIVENDPNTAAPWTGPGVAAAQFGERAIT